MIRMQVNFHCRGVGSGRHHVAAPRAAERRVPSSWWDVELWVTERLLSACVGVGLQSRELHHLRRRTHLLWKASIPFRTTYALGAKGNNWGAQPGCISPRLIRPSRQLIAGYAITSRPRTHRVRGGHSGRALHLARTIAGRWISIASADATSLSASVTAARRGVLRGTDVGHAGVPAQRDKVSPANPRATTPHPAQGRLSRL